MAGCRQHFVVTLDLHVLDIGAQFAPQAINDCQGLRVGLFQRSQDHFMTTEQLGIGGFHPALLGTGNRMPRHETRRHAAKRLSGGAHDVALGAADVGQNRLPQVHARQTAKHFFHGEDRYGELDHFGALACSRQVFFAAIHHTQFNRQFARLRIEIDPDHFAAQATLAQTLGKRTADQTQTDHHQAPDHRFSRLQCSDINHEPEPWSAPRGSGCFPLATRW
ncbi:hypothetical protein D3C86_1230820 [compost metagenome]